MKITIEHIYCGKSTKINDAKRKQYNSSYQKENLNKNTYKINKNGFMDDTQSDRESHGGIDKAVCVYSLEDYAYFEKKHNILLPSCAFGENLSIVDFNDSNICLGDQFICGEVIFEVSQPRQPCWKISSVIKIKNLTSMLVKEHRSGFYFRVLQSGQIKPANQLELLARPYPELSIKHINQIYFNAKENQKHIQEALKCDKISEAYKNDLKKRYKYEEVGLQEWQRDDYI